MAESAAHHPGYRIESFCGPIPDELLPSLCETKNLLAVDAPQGALEFEPERMDPEMFRQREALLVKQGRTKISTLAVSDEGEVVAFNDLVIPAGDRPNIYQWGTLVREATPGRSAGDGRQGPRPADPAGDRRPRPHAGHDLQRGAERPHVSINERLGFRPSRWPRLPAPRRALTLRHTRMPCRPLQPGRTAYGVGMLVAFSVAPSAADSAGSVSEAVAAAVRVVRECGLPNRTDSMFTTIEGSGTSAWPSSSGRRRGGGLRPRVSLVLKADIRPGHTGELTAKVERLEATLEAAATAV